MRTYTPADEIPIAYEFGEILLDDDTPSATVEYEFEVNLIDASS